MKSLALIGNKENALKFIEQIEKSVPVNKDVAEIGGQSVRLYFEPNISKVIKKRGGAIIVVTGNDNKTPSDVEACHAQLPNDFTFTYAQNKGVAPIGFLRQVINNPQVKNDEMPLARRVMFTLFGGHQPVSTKSTRPLRMQY